MPTPLTNILRSRWLALSVHLALWLLLCLTAFHLHEPTLGLHEAGTPSEPPPNPVPVALLGQIFAAPSVTPTPSGTNLVNPFFTRHFVPAPAPTPPPPTTRKVDVTYLGFYQAGDGPKQVVVKLAEGFLITRIGASVSSNLFVGDAVMQKLTLTNHVGQTNVALLNIQQTVEIPIR